MYGETVCSRCVHCKYHASKEYGEWEECSADSINFGLEDGCYMFEED